jgi:hypothetical protein
MQPSPASSQQRPSASSDVPPGASPLDQLERHHAPPWQDEIKAWIQEYQTAALLGGFAFGVFVGVWLRR